jgi:hypothetical protein
VAELPPLVRIVEEHRALGLELVTVSYDRDPARIPRFMERGRYDFPVGLDDRESGVTGPALQVGYIPNLILIDAEGVIRWRKIGFERGDEAEIRAAVRELLGPS